MVPLDRNQPEEQINELSDFLPPEKILTWKEKQDVTSPFQFMDLFPDEISSVKFMEDEIWGAFPFCGKCGSMDLYRPNGNPRMSHRCRGCKSYFSVRSGTVVADTNLPIGSWLLAVHLMLTGGNGVSALQLHKQVCTAQSTAWFLGHRIREAMRATESNCNRKSCIVGGASVGKTE